MAMLALGVYFIVDTIAFVNRYATIEGTVVGVERKTVGMEGGPMDFPTVRFVIEGGRSIVFTSNSGESDRWQERIGESVTVRYDQADPTNAKIDSFFQLWGLSAILFGIGGVFLFLGSGMRF